MTAKGATDSNTRMLSNDDTQHPDVRSSIFESHRVQRQSHINWLRDDPTNGLLAGRRYHPALHCRTPPIMIPTEPDHRHIRSFSGRRGHFTSGQRSAYEKLLPRYEIPVSSTSIDQAAIFGRDAPLVVEIGFGMGETTAAIAQAQPERNFIGIEVYPAGVGSLLRRINEAGLSNLRVIQHDAINVLQDMIAPASLAAVHVFFPDPWPKARHHKRRLIRAEIVELIATRLAPQGVLHCATDWAHYALQMLTVMSSEPRLQNTAGDVHLAEEIESARGFAERPAYRPLTKFERRGLGLGHGVWDVIMKRRIDL